MNYPLQGHHLQSAGGRLEVRSEYQGCEYQLFEYQRCEHQSSEHHFIRMKIKVQRDSLNPSRL